MWIYYYASFGPGHQSNDYGFKSFHDSYFMDDIEEFLHNMLSDSYNVILEFWKVERPSKDYVDSKIKSLKDKIRNLQAHLNKLKFQDSFESKQKKEKDPVLIRNISGCDIPDLLQRLHKAGFMYGADDISNWRYGASCLMEPERSKILRIMRRTKKYESVKEQLKKRRN